MAEIDPTIRERTPGPVEAIGYAARREIAKVRTTVPGVIEAYDAATQSAEVKVVIKRQTVEGVYFEDPVLVAVPVAFPQGGGFALHYPLAKGDPVTLVACERSLEEWLAAASPTTIVEPSDPRRHDLQDAIVMPGVSVFAQPIPAAMARTDAITLGLRDGSATVSVADDGAITLDNGACSITLGAGGSIDQISGDIKLGDLAAVALAKAGLVSTNFTNIAAVLGPIVTAWNAVAGAGGGPLIVPATPLPPYSPTDTATTKVKGT